MTKKSIFRLIDFSRFFAKINTERFALCFNQHTVDEALLSLFYLRLKNVQCSLELDHILIV